MVLKKEKASEEACSCNECKCGSGCCCGKILISALAVIWCIAAIMACIYACKASRAAKNIYDLNVLSAGWLENFNRMNKVYESEAYKEYATQNAEDAESYFGLSSENTDTPEIDNNEWEWNEIEINNSDTEEDNTNITEWGDDIKAVVENMLTSTPIRGEKDARFTIIEYTELLCPFCQRHSQEGTINAVMEQFPGEVNSISRHFIIHGDTALQLAAAMECVAELNPDVYHEAFDKAFEAYPVDMAWLVNIASELGTDATALQACIDEWKYTKAVEDMMNQGNQLFGINGTPGNVIIDRETGNYEIVSGAYPVETFVEAINKMKNA